MKISLTNKKLNVNAYTKVHPLVDDILSPTGGIILYQEQMMALYAKIVNGDLGDADLARRALVKYKAGDEKSEKKLRDIREKFFKGCFNNNIPNQTAEEIWTSMFNQRLYSFNRSHATAYALLSYETMFWKTYFRADFYCAFLNSNPAQDTQNTAVFDIIQDGTKISMPSINVSSLKWETDGTAIFAPFSTVRGVGINSPAALEIIKERPFPSFSSFNERVSRNKVNIMVRRHLYMVGAFDGLEGNPKEIGLNDEDINNRNVSPDTIMRNYFNIIIPSKNQTSQITKSQAIGKQVAGFIDRVEEASSDYYGDILVVYLSPRGKFRIKDNTQVGVSLEEKEFVVATGLSPGLYAKRVVNG